MLEEGCTKRKLHVYKFADMYRFLLLFLMVSAFISCSKKDGGSSVPDVIPDNIDGAATEINLTPIDINTPDKGTFFIYSNNIIYKVDFNATTQAASNAIIAFTSDTILNDYSREFSNLGSETIAYNPLADNLISIFFHDGRKIRGSFDFNTSFGVTGSTLISQWRDAADPTKPTQKAKNDIINLVHRYADKDGAGPQIARQYLLVSVSKK